MSRGVLRCEWYLEPMGAHSYIAYRSSSDGSLEKNKMDSRRKTGFLWMYDYPGATKRVGRPGLASTNGGGVAAPGSEASLDVIPLGG
jgi:hypothetical protein